MLPLCDDPVLLGQPYYAHEVHGSPQVCAVNPQRLEALVKGNSIFSMKSLLILNTDYSLTPILSDFSLLPDDKYLYFVTYFSLDFSRPSCLNLMCHWLNVFQIKPKRTV